MNMHRIAKHNNTGLLISRPYSLWNSGLVCLLIRLFISLVTSAVVFDMLFRGFNIECDYALMHRIIIICTAVFSLLQLNDIVLIAFLAVFGTRIYAYINANTELLKNGLMTMANQGYAVISSSLNLPPADGFDKVLSDTYLTVNSVSGIFAVILSVVVGLIVIRLCSRLLYALGLGLLFALVSLSGLDVSYRSSFILLLMFGIMLVLGSSRFSSFRAGISELCRLFGRKKFRIRQNLMYTLQVGIIAVILFLASFRLISGVYSKEKFEADFTDHYSDNIKTTARDIAIMKYAEYKKYGLISNVSLGQMGYISYVKPSKSRSMFSFVTEPITEGKLYFASFVGQDYHYRYNSWTEASEDNSVMVGALKAAGAEEKCFELSKSDYTAYPYYTDINEIVTNADGTSEATAYEYTPVVIDNKEYTDHVYSTYLGIDEENKEVIDKIIAEQGLSADMPDLAERLKTYFRDNYTYSLEQESLPYGRDFVNYFLEETRSGNFMHYASAITLIYRELGIPARYVGGYAVEAEQTLAGRRVDESRTRTNTKQLNMYSWVETYSPQGGWQMVDIVDAPDIEELNEKYEDTDSGEYTPNTSLDNYFRTVDREKYSRENITAGAKSAAFKALIYIGIFMMALFIVIIALHLLRNAIAFAEADISGRAYITMERLKKRLGISCTGYREAEGELALVFGSEKAGEITELAQRCVFSQNVGKAEYERLKRLCRMTPGQYIRAFALKHKRDGKKFKERRN